VKRAYLPLSLAARLASVPIKGAVAVGELGRGVERQVRTSLTGAAERIVFAAVDAVVARMLEEDVIDRVLERAEAAGVAQHVADRILEDGIAEQIVQRALAGPELERIVATAFASALPDEVIARLLASEAVWVLVDEIARSPSVTEAIAHQSTGFFEEVASRARDRSRRADVRVQHAAERLRRNREHGESGGGDVSLSTPVPREDAQ
jgi:hypothetical protein